MVVAIILLAILFGLSFGFNIICFNGIKNIVSALDDESWRQNIEEEILCNLVWTFKNNCGFDGTVTDFSAFQEKGIIGWTTCCSGNVFFEKEFYDEDGEPIATLFPQQVIYKMKDGGYHWEVSY